jgi:hypothetical protein
LLAWIEQHRHEFGKPTVDVEGKDDAGWGELETKVFDWVLESCRPEDCWAAIKVFAELNQGRSPTLRSPSFGNTTGRKFLLGIAANEIALAGDRARALALLADPNTVWPAVRSEAIPIQRLEAREQTELLNGLTPLLKGKTETVRLAAVRTILQISSPAPGLGLQLESKQALPALVAAYGAEQPGAMRDGLAEAICVIGGPQHWHELSGNPAGLLACLQDQGRRDDQVFFWLSLRRSGPPVYESPTLVLERLDTSNKVVEKKTLSLPVVNLPRPWSEGWDGTTLLYTQFPVTDLKAGPWRIQVQGTAGKDQAKVAWRSEPRLLVLEGTNQGGRGARGRGIPSKR